MNAALLLVPFFHSGDFPFTSLSCLPDFYVDIKSFSALFETFKINEMSLVLPEAIGALYNRKTLIARVAEKINIHVMHCFCLNFCQRLIGTSFIIYIKCI